MMNETEKSAILNSNFAVPIKTIRFKSGEGKRRSKGYVDSFFGGKDPKEKYELVRKLLGNIIDESLV